MHYHRHQQNSFLYSLMTQLEQHLKKRFGFDQFREGNITFVRF